MKMTVHVPIMRAGAGNGSAGYAQKELDLPFAPAIDSHIESAAWKEPRAIVAVSLNVDGEAPYNSFITLATHEVQEQDLGLQAYCYEAHGWAVSSGLQAAADDYALEHGYSRRARST